MIGQKDIIKNIDNLITENKFPRFTVITAPQGHGKKTLAKLIAKKLNSLLVIAEDVKIETMRNLIDLSYKQIEPTIYLIPDADKMSIGARNSLLKVIEEPPNNSYFIMTLEQLENTLSTIKSRCYHIQLQDYSESEIFKMIDEIDSTISSIDKSILIDTCINYRQLDLLIKYGVQDFYNYIEKVVDNIYKVQSANSFKITDKLDVKSDGTGYDINLFFQIYKSICLKKALDIDDDTSDKLYYESINITSNYQRKLAITGINKQSLLDMWILDIRKLWRN